MIVAHQLGLTLNDQRILHSVDARIKPGEFVSLVGPSGCGKTSLLRMVAGLQRSTSGQLTIRGTDPYDNAPNLPRRAFVFQDPTLLPWRDVLGNIALPLELQGTPSTTARGTAQKMLGRVGLHAEDAGKFPRALSGGMRMRVSLARALVTQPEILLLDEPFAALDDLLRQRMNEELLAVWEAERWTALFVTHHVAEAVFLSRRVLVLSNRPATVVAEVEVPFSYPRDPDVRSEPEFGRLTGTIRRLLRGGQT